MYTQTIQGTSQNKQYIEQHKKYIEKHNNYIYIYIYIYNENCSVSLPYSQAFHDALLLKDITHTSVSQVPDVYCTPHPKKLALVIAHYRLGILIQRMNLVMLLCTLIIVNVTLNAKTTIYPFIIL